MLTVYIKNGKIYAERGVSMSYKKQIVTIMTLVVLLLLTMSTTIQAASVGKVYGLGATMNGSRILLKWNSVSNASGYNIYINGIKKGFVNTNAVEIIGFSENTTYRFKVAACDYQKREGTASDEIRFNAKVEPTLEKVKNLTVSQVNGNVTLSWSNISRANKYQILVNVPNFGEINIGEVTTNCVMITGLKEGLRYGFSVRAGQTLSNGNTNLGEKATYQYCTISSNKDDSYDDYYYDDDYDSSIGTVTVSVYGITETEATVSWSRNYNADGYEVLLSKNGGSYKCIKDVTSATKTSVDLYDLDSDSYYNVKVVPYEKVNSRKVYGNESSYKSFRTNKKVNYTPSQVKNVYVSNINTNSAKVSWSSVSNAIGYKVYLSENNGSYRLIGSTIYSYFNMTGLYANTNYKVQVEAYNNVNGKEYKATKSSAISFKTSTTSGSSSNNSSTSKKPGITTGLSVQVKNINEAYLSWLPVDGAYGYEVWLAEKNGTFKHVKDVYKNSAILTSSELDYSTEYQVKVKTFAYDIYGNKKYADYFSVTKSFKTGSYNTTQNSSVVGKVNGLTQYVVGNTVYLNWNQIYGAEGYEIDFTVPGVPGSTKLTSKTNSKAISGVLDKNYYYTARVRAYKTVNGTTYYGEWSNVIQFKAK